MFSNKPSSVVGCIFTSLWIAASRIILILILLAGTYFVASKVAASFLCESELNLLFNAEQKSLPVSILCGVCTLIAAAVSLAYLYGYDKEKFFKDARILCMDFFILALGIIILLQSDSIEDLVSWMGVPTIFFVIYIVVCYNLFKGQISKEVNKGSCFGAEVDDTPDGINRGFFYNRTVDNIREALRDSKETGKVWTLYGEWGSGKTHLLNHVERILLSESKVNDNPEYIFSNINLWQISNREELWKAARGVLEKAYGISSASTWRQKIKDALSSASEVDAKCAIAHTICKDYLKNDDAYNLTHLRDIGKANPNKRFILFIDNLERTDAEVIKELLPLLERLKRLPNLLVIAAVAMQDLVSNLEKENVSEDLLRGHMIKLTDNVIYMPPIGELESRELFGSLIKKNALQLGYPTYLEKFCHLSYLRFDTIRQIYRAVDVLINLEIRYFSDFATHRKEEHVNGKSSKFVSLVYNLALLRVFYPQIHAALSSYCKNLKRDESIIPPDEYWKKLELNFKKEGLSKTLIQNICANNSRNDFMLADEMAYANRTQLLSNVCELLVNIAYCSYNSNIVKPVSEFVLKTGKVIVEKDALEDVRHHVRTTLNQTISPEMAKIYASVFLKDFACNKLNAPSNQKTDFIFSLLYFFCKSFDDFRRCNQLYIRTYISKLSFSTISSLMYQIACSLLKNDFMHCVMTIEDAEENNTVEAKEILLTKEGGRAIKYIMYRYMELLLNHIFDINHSLEPSSNVSYYQKFRAFDVLESDEFIAICRKTVLAYCKRKKDFSAREIENFIHYLTSFRIIDKNIAENVDITKKTLEVLEPLMNFIIKTITGNDTYTRDELENLLIASVNAGGLCANSLESMEPFAALPENDNRGIFASVLHTKERNRNLTTLFSYFNNSLIPTIEDRIKHFID